MENVGEGVGDQDSNMFVAVVLFNLPVIGEGQGHLVDFQQGVRTRAPFGTLLLKDGDRRWITANGFGSMAEQCLVGVNVLAGPRLVFFIEGRGEAEAAVAVIIEY